MRSEYGGCIIVEISQINPDPDWSISHPYCGFDKCRKQSREVYLSSELIMHGEYNLSKNNQRPRERPRVKYNVQNTQSQIIIRCWLLLAIFSKFLYSLIGCDRILISQKVLILIRITYNAFIYDFW